ncbi:MAG TPA: hypothetical protein VEL07_15170 [Planctomycetota bacterium]|nr:hypothetical protein [Planctomycetota bacterium]
MTPAAHAQAALAWLAANGRPPEALGDDHPLARAADALADAADHGDEATRSAGLAALFGGLVEPLNDGFSVAGRAVYAAIFARLAWRVCARDAALTAALTRFGITSGDALRARYERARRASHAAPDDARRIAVLSRVTIGADIALTSVALARLRQRYPDAELLLAGDAKLAGLFGGLAGVRVLPVPYGRRGPLRERFQSWIALGDALARSSCDLVVAPDSRLDQLGVLPLIADERRYLLWENTQPDPARPRPLGELLDDWLRARLALPASPPALPAIALDAPNRALHERLRAALGPRPIAAVKLDHGGNPAKALPRAAEAGLLRRLRERGWRVLIDRGFGADELANSDALLAAVGWSAVDIDDSGKALGADAHALAARALADAQVIRFHGSIAGWAGATAACGLAVSYDSVGHHLAAALGVPVVTAFTGYADPAFPIAWRPRGRGPVVVVEFTAEQKPRAPEWERWFAALPDA